MNVGERGDEGVWREVVLGAPSRGVCEFSSAADHSSPDNFHRNDNGISALVPLGGVDL